jgi:hypothetical protein
MEVKNLSSNKIKMSKNINIMIKRQGQEFVMSINAPPKDSPIELVLETAMSIRRSFSDAIDIYLMVKDKVNSETREGYAINLDMNEMRKIYSCKSEREEDSMLELLQGLLKDDFTVNAFGFPLNAKGKPKDRNKIYIDVAKPK